MSKQKGIALLLEAVKLASSSNGRASTKPVRNGKRTADPVDLARVLEGNVSDERTLTAAILGTADRDQSVKAIEKRFGKKIGAIVAETRENARPRRNGKNSKNGQVADSLSKPAQMIKLAESILLLRQAEVKPLPAQKRRAYLDRIKAEAKPLTGANKRLSNALTRAYKAAR